VQNSFQEPFDSPETVYRSCLDMQAFQQEVLRVVLLDARFRRITAVDVTKGTVNESLAHPREVFRPGSDRSGARRQLAERADRHVGSHNHSVHITQPPLWRPLAVRGRHPFKSQNFGRRQTSSDTLFGSRHRRCSNRRTPGILFLQRGWYFMSQP
jgi:hypothetical protein